MEHDMTIHELTVAVDTLKNDAIQSDDQSGDMLERIELLERAFTQLRKNSPEG